MNPQDLLGPHAGHPSGDTALLQAAATYAHAHPEARFWLCRRLGRREIWLWGSPGMEGTASPSCSSAGLCGTYVIHAALDSGHDSQDIAQAISLLSGGETGMRI